MMTAYDRHYLEKARISLGRMLDYGVYCLNYALAPFWELFLTSPVSKQFECGDVSILAGKSGVELALMVTGKDLEYPRPVFSEGRSPEYWLGWALAYFQWKTCISFSQLTESVPIGEILQMYTPHHEMDIRQFCDKVSALYIERKQLTNLKQRRLAAGLSQSQLAELTGIPVRTIQQYEQRQKSINRAQAVYVISLAQTLCCEPRQLLELAPSESAE